MMSNKSKSQTATKADPCPNEEEHAQPRRMADVLRAARTHYTDTVAYSGKASLNNGDEIAAALAGLTPRQVCDLAQDVIELHKTDEELKKVPVLWNKYKSLNPGQIRMNSGNRIRGAIKRGEVLVTEVLELVPAAITQSNDEEAA